MIRSSREIISLQCDDTYFPILDGVVRTIHNYATLMNSISGCYVVCPSQKGSYDDSALPYDVIRSASVKLPALNYGLAFPLDPVCIKKIISRKTHIAHIHSPFMTGMTVMTAARRMKIPVVTTFHSKYYSDFLQLTKSHFLAKTATDLVVAFYNRCDSVWACSEGTAETLRSYGYKKRITVMPNGCDMKEPENIEELRTRAKTTYRLTPEKKTLLFTGNLIWQKNLKLILDTYRLLEKHRPGKYRLVLAGTGNHEKEIIAYAKKICGESRVKVCSDLHESSRSENIGVLFTGGIYDRDLLAGVYSVSDLFFFPSVYDNAPLVLREAAALKTPSLTVHGSNAADVIIPDVNGYIAENETRSMAKKIISIMQDPQKLVSVGETAAQTIPVPWSEIVDRVYEEYWKILKEYKKN